MTATKLDRLLREIRACQVCAPSLPEEPKPILRAMTSATLLIVGQAPAGHTCSDQQQEASPTFFNQGQKL